MAHHPATPLSLQVCTDWFARIGPLALRVATATQHHPLTLCLGMCRLRALEGQARQLLASVPPSSPVAVVTFSAAGAGQPLRLQAAAAAAGGTEAGQGSWATKLLGRPGSALTTATSPASTPTPGADTSSSPVAAAGGQPAAAADEPPSPLSPGSAGASPAAALLAAARGGPALGAGGHGLLPGGPPRHAQQAQQLWAKAADAAAMTARALCALRDADGVAELRSYCASAFAPLERLLAQLGCAPAATVAHAGPAAGGATSIGSTASAGSSSSSNQTGAAWGWLGAVQLHAAGRYEVSLLHYASLEQQGALSRAAGPVRSLVAALQAEAFAAVQDWDGLQGWAQVRATAAWMPTCLVHGCNAWP